MRLPSVVLTGMFFVCALAFTWLAVGLTEQARLVPQIVLVPTLALLAVQLIFDLSPGWERLDRLLRLRVNAMPVRHQSNDTIGVDRIWADVAWFAAAPMLLLLIGLVPGGGVYVFSYLTVRVGVRLSRAAVYTIVTLALLWGVSEFLFPGLTDRGYLVTMLTCDGSM